MAKIRIVNVTEVVHQPLLLLQVEAVPVVESLNTAVTKLSDENVLETAEKIDFINMVDDFKDFRKLNKDAYY